MTQVSRLVVTENGQQDVITICDVSLPLSSAEATPLDDSPTLLHAAMMNTQADVETT